jgi:DNA-binding beta-propeller fold protein YncE
MKLKTFLMIILVIIITLTAGFLYLHITRSNVLLSLPLVSARLTTPVFLYSFGDIPGPENLERPMHMTFDGMGDLHVSDFEAGAVRVYSKDGDYLFSYGNTGGEETRLKAPCGLAYYNGKIYVADNSGRRTLVYSEKGEFMRVLLESGKGGAEVFIPTAVAVNQQNGNIYLTDIFGHRVIVVDSNGNFLFSVGSGGGGDGELNYPNGVALDSKSNIYIADSGNSRVQVFSPDGSRVESVIGGSGNKEILSVPRSLTVDSRGLLWLADVLTHTVSVFNGGNKLFELGGLGTDEGLLYFPNGIALSDNGSLYVAERGLGRISVFGFKVGLIKD